MTTQLAEREVVPAGWGALGGHPDSCGSDPSLPLILCP